METKITVIGDVHGELDRLKMIISNFGDSSIYCTGDIPKSTISHQFDNLHECIQLLESNHIPTVKGNHDAWVKDDISFFANLPLTLDIDTPLGPVLLCHGIGSNYMSKINPDDYGYAIESNTDLEKIVNESKYRIIINGHSHKKMVKKISGIAIINAGSLIHDPGFITIDFSVKTVEFYIFQDGKIVLEEEVGL